MEVTLWINNGKIQCDFKMPLSIEFREAQLEAIGFNVIGRGDFDWPGQTISLCGTPVQQGYSFDCTGVTRAHLRAAAAEGFRVQRLGADDVKSFSDLQGDVQEAALLGLQASGPRAEFLWSIPQFAFDGPGDHFPFRAQSFEADCATPITALVGRKLRVLDPTSMGTGDFDADRVTIIKTSDGRIEAIRFG